MTSNEEENMPNGENIEGDRQAQIAADVEAVKRAADSQHARRNVGTGQSPIVAEAALKCADCPHPGDEPCNTRASECGAAYRDHPMIVPGGLRFPVDPVEAATGVPRPPGWVEDNLEAIHRDLTFVADDDNETAPGDVIHPAWTDPNHPDAPRYVHVEIGSASDCPHNNAAECDCPRDTLPPDRLATGHYAAKVAQEAIELFTGPRNADYGDATDNFQDIADLWSVVLRPILRPGAAITAEQVAIMSALIKVARLNTTPDHDDSWTDGVAYLALGAGINRRRSADVGVDMPDAP